MWKFFIFSFHLFKFLFYKRMGQYCLIHLFVHKPYSIRVLN